MAGRFSPRPTRTTVRGGYTAVPSGVPAQTRGGSRTRCWTPPGPLDLGIVLGPLRRGPGDPTFRTTPDGSVWRATLTPAGPGTLRVALHASAGAAEAEAWGPGADWLLEHLPRCSARLTTPPPSPRATASSPRPSTAAPASA